MYLSQGTQLGRSRTQALTCRLMFSLLSLPSLPAVNPTAFSPSQQCRGVSGICCLTDCTLHSTDMICGDYRHGESHRPGRQPPHMPLFTGKPQWAVGPMHRTAGRSPVPGTGARNCLLTLRVCYWVICKGCWQVCATSATWDIFLGFSWYY